MACCEYTCRRCGHFWCDNGAKECPECGSEDFATSFDEDSWDSEDVGDIDVTDESED